MNPLSTDALLDRFELMELTRAAVFGAIPEEAILWLLTEGKILAVEKGENIFTQGDRGDSFVVILDGQISYYKFHKGQYAYIREYKAGEQIGFMSMIALHDRVGRAEAQRNSLVLLVDSPLFHAFHDHAPMEFGILMMNLAREMARTMRDVDDILVEKTMALS